MWNDMIDMINLRILFSKIWAYKWFIVLITNAGHPYLFVYIYSTIDTPKTSATNASKAAGWHTLTQSDNTNVHVMQIRLTHIIYSMFSQLNLYYI